MAQVAPDRRRGSGFIEALYEELDAIHTRLFALEAERSSSAQSLLDKLRNAEVRIEHLEDAKEKLTEQMLELLAGHKASSGASVVPDKPSTPPPPETAPPPGVVTEPPPPPSSTKPNESSAVPVAQTSCRVASSLPVKAPPHSWALGGQI